MENWFSKRKITKEILDMFGVRWGDIPHFKSNGIIIPITKTHSKFRRDPRQDIKPKYIFDTGLQASLFASDFIKKGRVVITEGEIDCMVLWSHNIQSVSGTTGALTFKQEWADFLKNISTEIIIALDNDKTGSQGMYRILKLLPDAKVLVIPDNNQVKDISDYVSLNGNIHDLLETAKHFSCIEDVIEDRNIRKANWQSTIFHDTYIELYNSEKNSNNKIKINRDFNKDDIKKYPISNFIKFTNNKCNCIFHNEKTPSMQYYPETNSVYCFGCGQYADVITVVKTLYNLSYKEAVVFLKNI